MTQQTMGQADAKEFFTLWEKLTNRMGSEDMTPHLVDMLNREHPTLRQQMVALLASLLNSINENVRETRPGRRAGETLEEAMTRLVGDCPECGRVMAIPVGGGFECRYNDCKKNQTS